MKITCECGNEIEFSMLSVSKDFQLKETYDEWAMKEFNEIVVDGFELYCDKCKSHEWFYI